MKQTLFTVKETSSFLKISPSTIYRYTRHGLIPYIKKNFGLRFRKEDLEKWMEQDKRKAILVDNILRNVLTNSTPIAIDKAKGGKSKLAKKGQTCFNYGYGRIYTRRTKQRRLRWYIDFHNTDGKRIREVVKDAITKEQALAALRSEVLKIFTKKHDIEKKDENIGFREFAQIYLQDYIMISRRNWKSDAYRLEKMKDYFEDTELTRITPLMIEKFRAERLRAGNCESTTNRYMALLKRFFSVAIEEGYVDSNPVKKVKFFSERATLKELVLTEEEEAGLIRECSERLRPIVVVALNTGMRKSEILGLRWSCVNLVKRVIKVEKAKSGKVRFVPINETLLSELQRLEKEGGKGEFVFPYRSVRTAFENTRRRAGLGGVRFHDLRHTFASRLIEKGVDIETIRALLGHSSIVITQRYAHANDERKRHAVDLLRDKKADFVAHLRHTERDELSKSLPIPSFSVN